MTAALTLAAGPVRTNTWQGSSTYTQIKMLTARSVRAWVTDPTVVVIGMLQPVIILFLLTQVFSRMQLTSSFPSGVTYFDFVLPAVMVDNAMQSSMQSGTALVEDLQNGFVARLRSLPVRASSLLMARSLTTLVRSTLQVAIIVGLSTVVLGYRPRGGFFSLAIAAALTLVIGWSVGWAFIAAGAWLRRAEPLQNLAIVVVYPLMFASSAYVPVADLPPWLAAVAKVNPLTYAINATRGLALGLPSSGTVTMAVLISAVIGVAGAGCAVVAFRRP